MSKRGGSGWIVGVVAASLLVVVRATADVSATQAVPPASARPAAPKVPHYYPKPSCDLPAGTKFKWISYLETKAPAGDARCNPGGPAGQQCSVNLIGALYEAPGTGKRPVVIFNHGGGRGNAASKGPEGGKWKGDEPCEIARVFVEKGYTFFAPYRRGNGPSTGHYMPDVLEMVGKLDANARDELVAPLLETHVEDVSAAFTHLKNNVPNADMTKAAVMGHSYGGLVTLFAAAKGIPGFKAAIDIAGGAQSSWTGNASLQQAVIAAAKDVKYPTFAAQSKQECAGAEPTQTLKALLKARGGGALLHDWTKAVRNGWSCQEVHDKYMYDPREGMPWTQAVLDFLKEKKVAP